MYRWEESGRIVEFQTHGMPHFHRAALAKKGGSFRVPDDIRAEFFKEIKPLLQCEDYKPYPTESVPLWRTKFRYALRHMKADGRVTYNWADRRYSISETGRNSMRKLVEGDDLINDI
jgi:hypothetical protein